MENILIKRIKYTLHSSKEDNYYQWISEINPHNEYCPSDWKYAFYEVIFEVDVDTETGEYKVVSVDIGNGQDKINL